MGQSQFPALSRIERRAALKGALRSALVVTAASAFSGRHSLAADIPAVGNHGKKVVLSDDAILDLQKNLRGAVILPSNPEYDATRRLWNGVFDLRPALIARCASAEDVQNAVRFARSHDLLVAVRCGGHTYAGHSGCNGGMVIDLRPIDAIEVDPQAQIARVGGGSLLGGMDRATMAHGLATTAGVISHTGIGGLATGGGQGRLQRKFGLTIDNIRAVEVVTADGRLLRASAAENPDLYWAVRGGGGNFGIVTKFEMQLHKVDAEVSTFSYTFPIARAQDLMKLYFDFSAAAPDELSVGAGLRTSAKGETTVSISGGYIGAPEAAEKLLAPIKSLGTPVATRVGGIDYVKLQSAADAATAVGRGYYTRVAFHTRGDEKLGAAMIDVMTKAPVPGMSLGFSQQGGASGRVAQDATAFANRDAQYQISLSMDWDDPQEGPDKTKNSRERWAQIKPLTDGGVYVNHAVDDDLTEIPKNYRGNYARLADLKAKFDPTNFFHLNANIAPKAAGASKKPT